MYIDDHTYCMMVDSIHIDCQNLLFIKEYSVKMIMNIIDHVCILHESQKCDRRLRLSIQ